MQIIEKEVLLFKSSGDDSDHENDDPYVQMLRQSQFTVRNLPVLDFNFTQLPALLESLLSPQKYSGIIFTSPRAVKAAALCLESQSLPKEWRSLQVYVVGESTAKSLLLQLGLTAQGSTAGNASNLADLILENQYSRPLLFPCGNLKRDILPRKLNSGGILLETITVYQSQAHPELTENLHKVTLHGTTISEYIVYFSPTGVHFTLPILQQMNAPLENVKIVAIGPTTHACLKESHVKVWSCATKPRADHLLEAILMQSDFS